MSLDILILLLLFVIAIILFCVWMIIKAFNDYLDLTRPAPSLRQVPPARSVCPAHPARPSRSARPSPSGRPARPVCPSCSVRPTRQGRSTFNGFFGRLIRLVFPSRPRNGHDAEMGLNLSQQPVSLEASDANATNNNGPVVSHLERALCASYHILPYNLRDLGAKLCVCRGLQKLRRAEHNAKRVNFKGKTKFGQKITVSLPRCGQFHASQVKQWEMVREQYTATAYRDLEMPKHYKKLYSMAPDLNTIQEIEEDQL